MLKGPEDEELLRLLTKDEVDAKDLPDERDEDPLRDDLDELVIDASDLRRRLGVFKR